VALDAGADILDRLARALAARYAVSSEIGRGGMAIVYRAEDLRHGRPVAIKVLRPDLGVALGPERFHREVRLVASLRHPHVLPLLDSGEADGLLYYVMPYVEGRSLRQRLADAGRLPVAEILRITRDVAEALSYAHAHGVIHRDIKPDNVLLEADFALLTDFGIAMAIVRRADERTTDPVAHLGTPEYMSPEQIFGDEPVDQRSDVYSLGCVVYEMLAGVPPFTGPTARSILARQAAHAAPPLATLRADVPEAMARAVERALAKSPADRYASAVEFAEALRTETAPPPGPGPSVAVLPFTDVSSGADAAFLAEGIAEEIITALSKLGDLRVAPRASSFSMRARQGDLQAIGRQLRVRSVLDGTLRRVGDRLRVTVQLVDTEDGALRWSERYDRVMADVFALQDEIARQVAGAFEQALSGAGRRGAGGRGVRAYEFYLRGRQFFREFRHRPMEHAREMFQHAIEADPRYARAYAGLADAACFLYMYFEPRPGLLEEAEEASRNAQELDPGSAEALASRGLATALRKDYAGAETAFAEAVRLDPRLFEAHYFWARACFQRGAHEDALRHYVDACALREDYQAELLRAQTLEAMGRRAEALRAYASALEVCERHVALNPDDARSLTMGGVARARTGDHPGAVEWVERALMAEPRDAVVLYAAACTLAVLGLGERAIEVFGRAIDEGFGNRQWIEEDPDFDSIRDDPRFRAILRRLADRSGEMRAATRPAR
jgi:TolB-like protein/tetratricopeptide (TPR) repeat protein/tRNA A-37 threonylcarbamoyl transferase component Bud32